MPTAAAATLLSGGVWWLCLQMHPLWWAAWLAPLPVLWLATRVRMRWAALAAFCAYTLGALSQWHYGHALLKLPAPVLLLMLAGPALIFVLTTGLYRRLALRGRPLAAALSVPVLWTAIGYLNAILSRNGTFGNIAYSQMDVLPVIQLAALTGLWGIGFLVMLAPAAAAVALHANAPRRSRWCAALLGGGAIALTLVYGSWRLHAAEPGSSTPMRIGLVSLEGPAYPLLSSPEGQQLAQRYAAAVEQLADQGAQMVVMPEVALTVTTPDIPALRLLAQQQGITVISGVDYRPAGEPERNMSLVFHPENKPTTTYTKHHLVVGFEDRFTPGRDYTVFDGAVLDGPTVGPSAPRIGLLICKDMDFPATSRAYAARAAQLLPVPAWDFYDDDWLHSRMAILRGVESGFAIARAARDGSLTLSDDRGRVLAEASSVKQDAQLIGSLPLRQTRTLYARSGDWFAWLDLAALVVLLGLALRPSRR